MSAAVVEGLVKPPTIPEQEAAPTRRCWVASCDEDISHRRSDAETCGPSHKRVRQRCLQDGHTCFVGTCQRCGRQVALPRKPCAVDGVVLASRTKPLRRSGAILRTRLASSPDPEYAPRPEDFIRPDGFELYEDARSLIAEESMWLDRVAPDPDYVKRFHFERSSDWKPASRALGTSPFDAVNNTPGPLEAHIHFGRQRGKAKREFERWLA